MDINELRGWVVVMMMILFIGICWWAFSPKRRQRFDEAANLPFADENQHQQSTSATSADKSQ